MSFSSIAVQWREKEAKKLRTFILYSLLASAGLHIGVLSLNIGSFLLTKVPEVASVPIELEIIETPNIKIGKQPEKQLTKLQSSDGGSSTDGFGENSIPIQAGGMPSKSSSSTQQVTEIKSPINKPNQPVEAVKNKARYSQEVRQQQSIPVKITSKPAVIAQSQLTIPAPNIVTSAKPQLITPAKITTEPESSVTPNPESTPTPVQNSTSTPAATPTTPEQNSIASARPFSREKLRELLAQGRVNVTKQGNNNTNSASGNSTASNGNGTGTGIGNGNSNLIGSGSGSSSGTGTIRGTGSGSGNGSGNGTGTGIGNGNSNLIGSESGSSTGTIRGTESGSGTGSGSKIPEKPKVVVTAKPTVSTGSKLSQADCEECVIKYPESARRRGVEGSPEVSIDYDEQGRVTKVTLRRSSGSDELDEALVSQARNFKLKPSVGGKQGVRVGANYAIANSQRYQELQERKRKREQRRQQELEAKRSIPNQSDETATNKPKKPLITDIPPETRNSRRGEEKPETFTNSQKPLINPSQESGNRQTPPKYPSNQNESDNLDEPKKETPTRKSSAQRLREVLRRQQPESPKPEPSTPGFFTKPEKSGVKNWL